MAKEWIKLGNCEDFELGKSHALHHKNKDLMLCHLEEGWFLLDALCPHQGESLVGGDIKDCVVTCPAHNWPFDLKSGDSPVVPDAFVYTYKVKLEEESVWGLI